MGAIVWSRAAVVMGRSLAPPGSGLQACRAGWLTHQVERERAHSSHGAPVRDLRDLVEVRAEVRT